MAGKAIAATLAPLSSPDQRKKKHCMEVVDRFDNAYAEAGRALRTIRDERLYIDEFESFDVFCRAHWKFSRQRAHQLIDASKVLDVVSTIVDTPCPSSESQARELAKLPTEQAQADAWAKAVETAPKDKDGNPKLTASHVRDTVAGFLPPPAEAPAVDQEPELAEPEPEPIEPGVNAAPEKVDGGYEPHEALPLIKQYRDLIGKVVRKNDEIRKIAGDSDETALMFSGPDHGYQAAAKLAGRLRGRKR